MSAGRRVDVGTNSFKVSVKPTDGLSAVISKLSVFLDGISLYTKSPANEAVPAELVRAVEKLTQTNDLCVGQSFQTITDGMDHVVQHIILPETEGAHVHLKACDLVTPEDLYDLLKQLVHFQEENARLLPPKIPANIATMYDIGFRENEKRIREGYAKYQSEIPSKQVVTHESNGVGKVAGQAGISFLAGFVIGAFSQTLRKNGFSAKSADLAIDALLLMYSYATGGTDAFIRVLMVGGALKALNAVSSTTGTTRITRTATSLAVLAILDDSIISVSGFLKYILNMSASVLGNVSANVLLADKPSVKPAPATKIQQKLKLHPPAAKTTQTFCGLKPGFLK